MFSGPTFDNQRGDCVVFDRGIQFYPGPVQGLFYSLGSTK
jgi:hypothetical protein